jgi:tripartite ATP-independent transporter DctM subunit
MDIGAVTILIFGCMLILLATGIPVSFALGGIALIFTYFLWGPKALGTIAFAAYDNWSASILIAAPLFLLMGTMLQESGIADEVYEMFYRWMGGLRGGLAIGTVIICTIFAAIMGISGASTITMGLIALPSMFKRGYNKNIVLGSIAAGGVLGILIPPSVIMIVYAMIARESVGELFAGGIAPGLLLASLYIIYIGIRSYFQPEIGPSLPKDERASWRDKFVSLRAVILPIILIILVLGTIYAGICTPTEASAVGASGAFICTAMKNRLTFSVTWKAMTRTFMLVGMVSWILLGASLFNSLYRAVGAQNLIMTLVGDLGLAPFTVVILMMMSMFILGMLMDDFAVVMLCAPIYVPIVRTLGFNTLWFAILFMVNMQMAYLTPPYGFNLFYVKSIVPSEITMGDIYRSVVPFVGLQILALIIIMIFPQIALWLPGLLK